MSAKTLKFEVTLKIEVDRDAYEGTFGMDESREEIRDYITDLVVESTNSLSVFGTERLAKITEVRN